MSGELLQLQWYIPHFPLVADRLLEPVRLLGTESYGDGLGTNPADIAAVKPLSCPISLETVRRSCRNGGMPRPLRIEYLEAMYHAP